ncbi:AAA family ATPase [Paenibacillus sp. GCM10023248]|uniref:AAA family ATPase n=1 Tax=Bacillales TaxID=1385 RepID=UPI002378137D|nr:MULTISPECIES: ATP-binding protein [Bacillales]MDD9267140.1 ATP-binding protein [Paenibacillus sp. MAHUQ-63]MDR6881360.1 putative kinase [Bacillus sp. 3255]
MDPTVIFLIGAAGTGKSTIGKRIASELQCCYLDKDTVCNKFTGLLLETQGYSPYERDNCAFYREVVMDIEYQALLDIADDNLKLGRSVVLDAPFLGYFSNKDYVKELSRQYDWHHIKRLALQVRIDIPVLKERLQARGLERDQWKLANWEAFVQSIQEKECLWEDIEMKRVDNSSIPIDRAGLMRVLGCHEQEESVCGGN